MKLKAQKILAPVRVVLRSQAIGWGLYRYGVAGTLASLGFEIGRRGIHWVAPKMATPRNLDSVFGKSLAQTFVQLGPTFIKLGQVLATRPDLVGEPVAMELRILFDKVPPIPFSEIQKILKREWGAKKFKASIKMIDRAPLGSASIGQTHRAILKDGSTVILKIQKPGASETVRADLTILEGVVRSVDWVHPKLGLASMFRDFRDATLCEIDYREEAKNIDRFRKNYRKVFSDTKVMIPRYLPELLTEKVLVLEPMRGSKVSDLKSGTSGAKKAASLGLSAILEQIFEHGFFHADPHGGNLFYLEEEGKIGFIDLGLVGQLTPEDKTRFLRVVMALLKRDRQGLAKGLFDLGIPSAKTEYARFEADVEAIIEDLKKKGLQKTRMDKLLSALMTKARDNGIYIPNRYALMLRSCLVMEGVARTLDPSVSLLNVALPVVSRSLFKSLNPLRRIFKV